MNSTFNTNINFERESTLSFLFINKGTDIIHLHIFHTFYSNLMHSAPNNNGIRTEHSSMRKATNGCKITTRDSLCMFFLANTHPPPAEQCKQRLNFSKMTLLISVTMATVLLTLGD